MVLISKNKIIDSIKNKSLSMKEFVIYSFISFGSMFSVFRSTKYPVVSNEYSISQVIILGIVLIWIIGFVRCYKIVKDKNVSHFAYMIVPLITVLKIRYGIFLMIPLIIIEVWLIRYFGLNFPYWNAIISQIINLLVSLVTVVSLIDSIKKIYIRFTIESV